MKKIIEIIIISILFILILNTCKKKCESNDLGKISFTPTDLQIVQYNRTDTLSFSDSLGNLQIFKGIISGSNYNDIHYQNSYNGGISPADFCYGNYFATEHYFIQYNEGKDLIGIDLSMNGGNPFFQNINKIFNIHINYAEWYFNCSFYFDAIKLNQSIDLNESKLFFIDSLKIGKKNYKSVYVLEQIKDPETSKNLQFVFYTIKEGIIGFRSKDGHTWYLKN